MDLVTYFLIGYWWASFTLVGSLQLILPCKHRIASQHLTMLVVSIFGVVMWPYAVWVALQPQSNRNCKNADSL